MKEWGLSRNGDCQKMGIVREWRLSRNGDCQGMGIVKEWRLSRNGDCQGMGIVKEWGLSRNGDCHGMGIVSEWRQKYLKISKTSKKTISTFSILCHGIVCRMNSPFFLGVGKILNALQKIWSAVIPSYRMHIQNRTGVTKIPLYNFFYFHYIHKIHY